MVSIVDMPNGFVGSSVVVVVFDGLRVGPVGEKGYLVPGFHGVDGCALCVVVKGLCLGSIGEEGMIGRGWTGGIGKRGVGLAVEVAIHSLGLVVVEDALWEGGLLLLLVVYTM